MCGFVKVHKLNTETSSKINRSLVLGLIHRNPLISRAEIAGITSLDRSTITHILNYLLREDLVKEVQKGKAGSRGGRCPILLQINYDMHYLIAIEIGIKRAEAIITSLKGEEIFRHQREIHQNDKLLEILIPLIDDIRSRYPVQFAKGVVIGVSCPGVIDTEKNSVRLNLLYGWRDVTVGDELYHRYKKHIFIENDANAAAMGELKQSSDKISSLLYLFIRESPPESRYLLGVGGAFIINHKLWHGAHYFAGEIAQTVNSLFQRVMEQKERRNKSDKKAIKIQTLSHLLHQAQQDIKYRNTIDILSDRMGELLSTLAAFIDPEALMVYIHPPEGKEEFLEKIQKAFYHHHNSAWGAPVQFLTSSLGSKATLNGLIALAQDKIFVSDTSHPSILFE